jgi:hypothetical protein
MQAKESWFAARGNPKMKLQGSGVSSREILQSQISLFAKNRFNIKELTVVRGRLCNCSEKTFSFNARRCGGLWRQAIVIASPGHASGLNRRTVRIRQILLPGMRQFNLGWNISRKAIAGLPMNRLI